jgi:integrase
MEKPPKVVTILSPSMRLPDTVTLAGRLTLRAAPELPFISYPDGRSCPFANMYVLRLYNENFSLINDGGTVSEYAYEISHIIRFAFDNKISLFEISDLRFKQFRNWLEAKKKNGVRKTGTRQVIKIMTRTLDFLSFIGMSIGNDLYVSPNGLLRGTKVIKEVRGPNKNPNAPPTTIVGWTHLHIPIDDGREGRGEPIGDDALDALKFQAASKLCPFLKRRTELMLMFYEHLGGRRGEVVNLQISDIESALESGEFITNLMMSSYKGARGKTREVPVFRFVLEEAMEFVKTQRKIVMDSNWKGDKDHGFLFVSVRTGKPLSTNYITNIFQELRKKSGIEEKAHAHQLRHLAITRWYWSLLMKDYAKKGGATYAQSSGAVRIRTLKLMQFAGHIDERSAYRYVHDNDKKAADMTVKELILENEELLHVYKTTLISVLSEIDAMSGLPVDIERIKTRIAALLSIDNEMNSSS